VVAALTKLTSRSLVMMSELRQLWYPLDSNDIHVRPRYIRSTTNIWADTLSREMDIEDWELNPKIFPLLHDRWGPHSIDRFAPMLITQLPRFNARCAIARTSTAYIYRTQLGAAKTTTAIRLGPLSQSSPPNYASPAHLQP
jgi:hypothetical protein